MFQSRIPLEILTLFMFEIERNQSAHNASADVFKTKGESSTCK